MGTGHNGFLQEGAAVFGRGGRNAWPEWWEVRFRLDLAGAKEAVDKDGKGFGRWFGGCRNKACGCGGGPVEFAFGGGGGAVSETVISKGVDEGFHGLHGGLRRGSDQGGEVREDNAVDRD